MKIEEKSKKNKQTEKTQIIKLDYLIKEKLSECDKTLTLMNDVLRK